MKSPNTYIVATIPGIIVGVVIALGIKGVFAWTVPSVTPPGGNVQAPINVSGNTQTKAGTLILSASVYSPIFVDLNDGNYYVDPNGVSFLNDIRPNIMYDRQNTAYYVDPNGSTVLNSIYSVSPDNSNWGLLIYSAGWGANSNPQSHIGSIYANDVYLRSVGRWASQGALPDCRICAMQGDSDGHWGPWTCSPFRTEGGGPLLVNSYYQHGDHHPTYMSIECR